METALTNVEQTRLADLESTVERGLATAFEVGLAFIAIRNENLYHDVAETYEEYLRIRWDLTPHREFQLTQAAEINRQLETSTMVEVMLPQNERQVRELAKLPEEDRPAAWVKSVEGTVGADGRYVQPTAKQVAGTVKGMQPKREPSKKQREKESRKRGLAAVGALYRALIELGEEERFKGELEEIKEWLGK